MADPREKPTPPAWRQPIQDWAGRLRTAGRSVETIRTRTDHLRRAARALGGSPWRVTEDALVGWVGSQDWARETRRSVYASLRGFYRWAVRAGHVEVSPADGLPSVRPEVPCPRPTPEVEYRRAVSAADPRVRLILRLAAQAGLRRAEIAQIHQRSPGPVADRAREGRCCPCGAVAGAAGAGGRGGVRGRARLCVPGRDFGASVGEVGGQARHAGVAGGVVRCTVCGTGSLRRRMARSVT